MIVAFVIVALAAVASASAAAWLVVDRRRVLAELASLADRVDRGRRDVAADLDAPRQSVAPAAALAEVGGDALDPLLRLDRTTADLTELAGRAAELRARSLRALDAIPQGVVIADASGTVVARNLEATPWVAARHGEALVEVAIEELIGAAAAGRPDHRTIELVGPPSRTVVLTATPVTGGGVVVIDDVSERRRVEALRRDFVANISHELRTPVGALGLLAETLLTEAELLAGHPGSAVVERLAERLYHEALRLGRTIDDLLELSRIEAGEPLAREPLRLADVVAAAVDRTQPAAELRDVRLRVAVPDPDAKAWGDRRQLVSAIANLVDNAVKYSDPGGEVEVEAGLDANGGALLVVRDHGIGIPEADQQRVFERFYRVDRARRRDTGGTGLGLAIVRHVALNHGGTVEVSSREGEGAAFSLRLPPLDAARPDGAREAPTAVPPAAHPSPPAAHPSPPAVLTPDPPAVIPTAAVDVPRGAIS